ncbi:MAG: tRNA preQ1(34) S-adenosylmethionine ribosyltransferase-isomerase QueA [Verrucomicrobiales bacterium]|nr:tRNA preQ1(34) S-adenosylmethionine ribosyltransferase-isomerase QueA [Verrucomicrobiales bacterium]MCP5526750.1 tRNA preQ1(34) S-adenosylmethionine ribosyltransferase-isomerase QueA [Verrucomicrobiales bacterium]
MLLADFDYDLPPERIAQHPADRRDASRLLVLRRADGRLEHREFPALAEYLQAGDLLVVNNSRVIPARLRGRKLDSGGEVEILLVEQQAANDWWTLLKPGRRVRPGTRLDLGNERTPLTATVREKNTEGHCRLSFEATGDVLAALDELGEVPLPPYIERSRHPSDEDRDRYQTVYARPPGSVAAPTAGLHFTGEFLELLRDRGVRLGFVTLHVGLGTFAPVKAERVADHVMHAESYELPATTAELILKTRRDGGRVVAVGTTSLRVLESVAARPGGIQAAAGKTRLFVHPPHEFRVVDALLTNFHLPRSTLLMLVSAFAAPGRLSGRELVLRAYTEAVRADYRFFSYGDAMLLL